MQANHKKLFLSIFFGSALSISTIGQTVKPPTNDIKEMSRRGDVEAARNREQISRSEIFRPRTDIDALSNSKGVSSRRRDANIGWEFTKQYERTADQLIPTADYFQKYKDFLKGDKHELARLQPEKNCLEGYVASAQDAEKCADTVPVRGNGSYYSFVSEFNFVTIKDIYGRKPFYMFESDAERPLLGPLSNDKRLFINNWWNIHFDKNRFEVAKDGVQGVIADLGKINLNSVTATSPELKVLTDYQPGETFEDVQTKIEMLAKGITSNNLFYSNSAPVQIEHTYILRSIHYPYKPEPIKDRPAVTKVNQIPYTSRGTDITVAFQIVGRENDGSIVILWKELDKKKLTQKYKI